MKVTVKKTPQSGDCLHYILLIVGVASAAKFWRLNPQISLLAGSCTFSEYFPSSLVYVSALMSLVTREAESQIRHFRHAASNCRTILTAARILVQANGCDNRIA